MNTRILAPLALAVVLGTPVQVSAQNVSTAPPIQSVTVWELALRDGSRLYGSVETENDREVVFRTQSGTTLTVNRGDILLLRKTSGVLVGEEFAPADPNTTRLFFGPTGRSLQRGQTYVGMYEFMMPFVQVGITDRVSFGGGTPLVFGEGVTGRPYWITPKVQVFRGEATQVAVGVFHGFAGADDYAGVFYAVGTHGDAASSFTVGIGRGYSGDGGHATIAMLGAERQFRRNMKLVTENYVWTSGGGSTEVVASGGIRFFGERLSADLGVFVPVSEVFLMAPLVNFVYIF